MNFYIFFKILPFEGSAEVGNVSLSFFPYRILCAQDAFRWYSLSTLWPYRPHTNISMCEKMQERNVLFSLSAATPASKNHVFLVKAADLFCFPQRPWELLLWHGALLKFLAAAGLLKDLCKNPGSAEMSTLFSRSYQVIHQIVFFNVSQSAGSTVKSVITY